MNVERTAKLLLELYHNNRDLALAEVFNMAKVYNGKAGDMPNHFWRDVFILIQDITSSQSLPK